MTKKNNNSQRQPFIRFLFVIYCGVMIWLLFGRSSGWNSDMEYWEIVRSNLNFVPLYTICNYLRVVLYRTNDTMFIHCLINLFGNVILFIPIGFLLPKIWNKQQNFFIFLLSILLIILIIEALQLFTLLGSFDIDDIILNLPGMIIGYLIWLVTR